jgi:uncharacterized damage-inducible protein DinB
MPDEIVYRPGINGALVDEYERALLDLARTIHPIKQKEFTEVLDEVTKEQHCRSIQRIMEHVISSGYEDADYIRRQFGKSISPPPKNQPVDALDAIRQLETLMIYMLESFEGRWEMIHEEIEKTIIKASWGNYNLEQFMEHAIVHVLRHRRQITHLLTHPKKKWSSG